ncbi:subtilisin serine protease [Phytophthora sojae]|uniref:subtilisin n=1 Tax=Phytophthora sojae (strain P6497) TaxID=1094619 RepID=G5A5V3_PHYSP|nr:subtilisin serine protease [Phytophthora sojae]EGZ08708.1 subtilisin serine protease [Phytophthora sojae]|eukprot:XP_009535341.1 subtilisin serine protease [Phytophthora sojae]
MKDNNTATLQAAADSSTAFWTEAKRIANIQNIVTALKQHADSTQGPVKDLLVAAGVQFQSRWITNTIEVLNAPLALVQQILTLVIVKEIIFDLVITLDPPTPTADSTSNTPTAGWGATKIKATNVWAASNSGQNVVVGTIDTGVRSTHEVLRNNWIGAYGWYDPDQKTATPYDANGHGTHTMATIAGINGVGIAPGVTWMTCKGCGATSCTLSLLTACAQFMLCPTDTNGNNCNAAKAPHIVSNSWGAGQGMTYFQPSLDAWYAARILPVFATGNNGANGCSTVVSPGDSARAFAIGATDTSDALGSFSSLGPSVNGLVKPDFAGPGVSIRSAWNSNDTAYTSLSGTSMAAPHLAGTIALALSARPGFCFDTMKSVLTSSTDQALPNAVLTCGGTGNAVFPNNQYGYGRINAQNVVNAALAY